MPNTSHSVSIISSAIAAIYDQTGKKIRGLGFAVGKRHVITCAHVVNAAVGLNSNQAEPPPAEAFIRLSFPHSEFLKDDLYAKVITWLPKPPIIKDIGTIDDIAVLELIGAPCSLDLPLSPTREDFYTCTCCAYGFNIEEGKWVSMTAKGRTTVGTIQIICLMECVYTSTGFSNSNLKYFK